MQGKRMYVHDNPRRLCLKKANPNLFTRVNELKNARLPEGEHWAGFGNLFLLDKPDLMAVQVSRRATDIEIVAMKAKVIERIETGAVVVSPFISAGEKEIARLVMAQGDGGVILLKPDGFPPLYKPSGKYFDLCAQGRLLVLSAFPYTGHIIWRFISSSLSFKRTISSADFCGMLIIPQYLHWSTCRLRSTSIGAPHEGQFI